MIDRPWGDWHLPQPTTGIPFMRVPNDELRTVKYDNAHTS